jgi:hypothetical protein
VKVKFFSETKDSVVFDVELERGEKQNTGVAGTQFLNFWAGHILVPIKYTKTMLIIIMGTVNKTFLPFAARKLSKH